MSTAYTQSAAPVQAASVTANAPAGADLSAYPYCMAPADTGLLGLRLAGLFGILAVSTIGIGIPYFAYSARLKSLFFCLRAFASGVVLTTGYVHVLGDAYPILTDPCLGWSGTYPWAMTIATGASLVTFVLEWTLHRLFEKSHGLIEEKNDLEANPDLKDPESVVVRTNMVIAYTFEIGIIFHSIFIGITLGISSNAGTVTALMIALFFHQGNEGLALGVLMVRARYSRLKYFILAAAFVVVTPLGVAIGIGVNETYNGESHAALGSEGVFDSVSAGILIYNGLVDLIVPTFSREEIPDNIFIRVIGFAALFAGAGIMALIGKWA